MYVYIDVSCIDDVLCIVCLLVIVCACVYCVLLVGPASLPVYVRVVYVPTYLGGVFREKIFF